MLKLSKQEELAMVKSELDKIEEMLINSNVTMIFVEHDKTFAR